MRSLINMRVKFNRTADVNAYTAGDVIGPAVTNGAGILTLGSIGDGYTRTVSLRSAGLLWTGASLPVGMTTLDLHLYNALPASAAANGDNGAFSLVAGDQDAYLGKVQFAAPDIRGASLFSELTNVQKQLYLPSGALYGVLVTTAGFTPLSATAIRVEVGIEFER